MAGDKSGNQGPGEGWRVSPAYAWLVFALTFALLLSDYMSRQVLVAVFPALKHDWRLTDVQLGGLVSIVALMVGLFTFPLSVAADRLGRVRSVALMALLWSLATAACGLAETYGQMFIARMVIGVGEAAYGSVGAAVLVGLFPKHLRGTITGSFLAGGAFGSMAGLALGGLAAQTLGWRSAFHVMAGVGVVLALVYLLVVTEKRLGGGTAPAAAPRRLLSRAGFAELLRGLFTAPSALFAYAGSGLQFFLSASALAWLPSLFQRSYGLPPATAATLGGAFVLLQAFGMVGCGVIADRLSRNRPSRKANIGALYGLMAALLMGGGFLLPPGLPQLIALGCGMLFAAGASGPAGAIAADVTPPAIHASVMATFALCNNLLGLAPGPVIIGHLADQIGLARALQVAPLAALAAAGAFLLSARFYDHDAARVRETH